MNPSLIGWRATALERAIREAVAKKSDVLIILLFFCVEILLIINLSEQID